MSDVAAKILDEILDERKAQDKQWGGPKHDNQHFQNDWIALVTKHAGRAVMWPLDRSKFRKQMVIVAALAIAAIEWEDRK